MTDTLCDDVGSITKVGELIYCQPVEKVKIAGENIVAKCIDFDTEGFVGAISW